MLAAKKRLRRALIEEVIAIQRLSPPVAVENAWSCLVERAAEHGGQRTESDVESAWQFAFALRPRWLFRVFFGWPEERLIQVLDNTGEALEF